MPVSFAGYIKKYYRFPAFCAFLLLSAAAGCIPAALISAESRLVDSAIFGISGSGFTSFGRALIIFAALTAGGTLLSSLLGRCEEKHLISTGTKLDSLRIEKANRVKFHLTETQHFHELLETAEKAAENDSSLYKSLRVAVTGAVAVVTTIVTVVTIDITTAVLMAAFIAIGVRLSTYSAKNADSFWGEYIKNMRRANYFSSLLMNREYAAERKVFRYNDAIEKRYDSEFSSAEESNSRLGRRRLNAEITVLIFSAVYAATIILLLARLFAKGSITIGVFYAVFSASGKVRSTGAELYAAVFDARSSWQKMHGFFEFMGLEEENTDICADIDNSCAEIVFDHVYFRYPNSEKYVLEDISLTLSSGRHYALVGENGCGKTTFVKLMLGLYAPTRGEILINGIRSTALTEAQRRQLFTVMFQDFYRYPLTVKEVASLSSSGQLQNSEISEMLCGLGIHSDKDTSEGFLDKELLLAKQGGSDLSGGEWQKLIAARCLLSDAPAAALDEPNAALDPLSEEKFYRLSRQLLSGKTTLFISHRLGGTKDADIIYVLKNAKLIAGADHKTLMQECGYYAMLYNTQKGLYEI